MQGSFKVGTIGGIAIRIHYTWIFAVLLIAWSLALGSLGSVDQDRGAGTDWLLAIIAALLLFGSVLVHEIGHSLVARARGLRVEDITLFIFGGVSSIAQEAATAWDEFVVAVVGPLISLALAGMFWAVGQVVPPESAVSLVARYLAMANLLLGLFNIVPGFPLDGVPVTSVMDPSPATAGPGLSVRDFVQDYVLRRGRRALPVVEAGQLVGMVSITDARDVPQDAWATTRVDEVMTRPPLETLAPEADLGRPWSGWSTAGSTSCPSCATGRWSACSAAPTSCTTCS